MIASEGRDLLALLYSPSEGVEAELSSDGAAALKLWRTNDPDDYAIVSASGTGWFELSVRGRFGTFEIDEDASVIEATDILQRYLAAAAAYLDGRATSITTRVLRRPAIRIDSDHGPIRLDLTLNDAFRSLVNPRRTEKRRKDKRPPS